MIRHGSVLEELPGELAHRPYAEALAEACELALFPQEKKIIYNEDMISERDIAAKCEYAFGEGETKKAKSVAASMLADGQPVNLVSKYTGLSEAEVLALKTN